VKAAAELEPDIVFLDVQMPKLDGFEVAELLGSKVAVVFVTAYDEYALKAFDLHAVDYLLKPFGPERLAEALDRARQRIGQAATVSPVELASAARSGEAPRERVLVSEGTRVHVIPVETIDFIEAQDDYVSIRVGDKRCLKEQTLADLEPRLDPAQFVRTHRSYILNVDRPCVFPFAFPSPRRLGGHRATPTLGCTATIQTGNVTFRDASRGSSRAMTVSAPRVPSFIDPKRRPPHRALTKGRAPFSSRGARPLFPYPPPPSVTRRVNAAR